MKAPHIKCSFCLQLLASLISLLFFIAYAEKSPWAAAPEIRAVWMDLDFNSDPEKGRKEVLAFVDRMAGANFNVILPWVPTEYIAALTDEAYQRSRPVAKWDALGELIKASHTKGIQVHVWYSFTAYKSSWSPEFNPVHGGNPAWASVTTAELKADRSAGKQLPKKMGNMCPLHQDGRGWELRTIEKLLERYPLLSGIHIEEPGYDGDGVCVCDLCLKLFQSIYGFTGIPDVNGPQATDLKCLGTTEFMRELRKRMKARNRDLVLSTNGHYLWQLDREKGRDWKRWAEFKWLDFYVPQVYWNEIGFREYLQAAVSALGSDCPVAVGIAVKYGKKGQNSVETVLKEIDIARQIGAKGVVIFKANYLTEEYLAALKSGPFSESVSLPKPGK